MRYEVVILYREPSFERIIGRVGPPYRYALDVQAHDLQSAFLEARACFDEMAKASWAGWRRQIVMMTARLVIDAVADDPDRSRLDSVDIH